MSSPFNIGKLATKYFNSPIDFEKLIVLFSFFSQLKCEKYLIYKLIGTNVANTRCKWN